MRNLLSSEEVTKLKEGVESSPDVAKYAYTVEDGKGGKSRLCIWNHPGNDITGTIVR